MPGTSGTSISPCWGRAEGEPGGSEKPAGITPPHPGEDVPVFLLTVFAKNEKASLGTRERTVLVSTSKQMIEDYRKRK